MCEKLMKERLSVVFCIHEMGESNAIPLSLKSRAIILTCTSYSSWWHQESNKQSPMILKNLVIHNSNHFGIIFFIQCSTWENTYRPKDVDILITGHQVGVLGCASGCLQFVSCQHPYLSKQQQRYTLLTVTLMLHVNIKCTHNSYLLHCVFCEHKHHCTL